MRFPSCVKSIVAGLAAAGLLFFGSLEVQAQSAVKLHRIGVVSPVSGSPEPSTVRALRQGLRDLGYVEGKNLVIEARYAEGHAERLPGIFAELIALKVDVLVTGSNPGTLAAKRATASVPIVFGGITDATPFVASLARPGGNITGATFGVSGTGIAGKWLELLKEAAPRVSRVAVLMNSSNHQSVGFVREIRAAAQTFNVRIDQFDAESGEALV